MIIGIFGPFCVGKTTLARNLGDLLGLPYRLCGDAVRARARMLNIDLEELSEEEHRNIDRETREWAAANQPCIVDGRYLDYVLAPLINDVILVRLDAADEERRRRRSLTLTEYQISQSADLAFSARMYSISKALLPSLVLSSSELSVEACAQRIKVLIASRRSSLG
jgi:cytidylate kinase